MTLTSKSWKASKLYKVGFRLRCIQFNSEVETSLLKSNLLLVLCQSQVIYRKWMGQEISKRPRQKIFQAKTNRTDQWSTYRTGENTRWRSPYKCWTTALENIPVVNHSAVGHFFKRATDTKNSRRRKSSKHHENRYKSIFCLAMTTCFYLKVTHDPQWNKPRGFKLCGVCLLDIKTRAEGNLKPLASVTGADIAQV